MNDAHASATTTHRGFHDNGIADLPRDFLRFRSRLDRILSSRKDRNPR